MTQTIAIVGGGYVGLTSAVCFADLGHSVRVLDVDQHKVDQINAGRVLIYEEGLEPLLSRHVADGNLFATSRVDEAIPGAAFVFLCVPTPSTDNGAADLTYLDRASRDIAGHLDTGAVIVNKSTVPVGSTDIVKNYIDRPDVTVASNPEFLREGTAIYDFMHPDRIVIGCHDLSVAQQVAALYTGVAETTFVLTDAASAELIKYASNAYLATRLTFINAVAEVCEVLGADIGQVSTAIGLDSRIGPDFLNPGPGWGGSCFPKDTRALAAMADKGGYEFKFLNAVISSNEDQFDLVAERALEMLGGTNGTIAALGLAFKAGTDDVRSSPAVAILDRLAAMGVCIQAHDPEATVVHPKIAQVDTPLDAVRGADLILVLTEWPVYSKLDPAELAPLMRRPAMLDTRNIMDRDAYRQAGFEVRQPGRSELINPCSPVLVKNGVLGEDKLCRGD